MWLNRFLSRYPIISYLFVFSILIITIAWLRGGIEEHLLTVTISVYFGSIVTVVFFGVYGQSKAKTQHDNVIKKWEKIELSMKDQLNHLSEK